ncbi:egf family domain-containing protein [Cystoisospora suis]|uniref:Egf family domain-containing protein n=1 Tax=Cystoisospora suis TaxID=483139 RepID=A0A2C6LF13_9APIC|nr:egf family domain-containing protein [Cystoisospora suis]
MAFARFPHPFEMEPCSVVTAHARVHDSFKCSPGLEHATRAAQSPSSATYCRSSSFRKCRVSHVRLVRLVLGLPTLLAATCTSSASAAITLPSQAEWVCRISEAGQRCGDVYENAVTHQKGGICRKGYCCAKFAVANNLFGDICTDDQTACRSKNEPYSDGKCSLEEKCSACAQAAKCKYDNSSNGGVYCHCEPPGEGTGKTCKVDPCRGRPCVNGTCKPRQDDPSDFKCSCLPGYVAVKDASGYAKSCVDVCSTGVCGDGALACYNGETTYTCACKPGYVNLSINGNDSCVRPNFCDVQPCGDSEAVKSCKMISNTEYECECQAEFALTTVLGRKTCTRKLSN